MIASSGICFTGMKSVAWYHWNISGFVLFAMRFLADWCVCGGGCVFALVILTCHMPTRSLRWTYKTCLDCLNTFMYLPMNLDVHPSSHINPIYTKEPDWSWGKMGGVLAMLDRCGVRWRSSLYMACMTLPSGISTWGPLDHLILLVHGFFTLV